MSDLIKRSDAIEALWDMTTEDCPNPGAAVGKCMEVLRHLPSAYPYESKADRKTEPTTEDCSMVDWKQRLCDMYGADRKSFDEAWNKYEADKLEDEPQTE